MTTIAYRDGVLAADSGVCSDSGWCMGHTDKLIHLPDGGCFGCSGDGAEVLVFERWMTSGRHGSPEGTSSVRAIVVWGDGSVQVLNGRGDAATVRWIGNGFVAIGSGWPVAVAAMMAGADAVRAVEIAIELDPYSSGPVSSWYKRLEDERY